MLFIVGAVLLPSLVSGHHKLSREQCAKLSQRMERLQSKLRQGHSARQGRKYREQMRELQLTRHRKC